MKERQIAGVKLFVSGENYNEYKRTLKEQLEEKDKEIERLNNIIDEFDKWLLGEKMIFYTSDDGKTMIIYEETITKWLELKEGK